MDWPSGGGGGGGAILPSQPPLKSSLPLRSSLSSSSPTPKSPAPTFSLPIMPVSTPNHQSSVPVPIVASSSSTPTPLHRNQQSLSSLPSARAKRSSSRLSWASRTASGSRASDDESKTSVRVVVRVRPVPQPADCGPDLIPQRFQTPVVQVQSPTVVAVDPALSHGAGTGFGTSVGICGPAVPAGSGGSINGVNGTGGGGNTTPFSSARKVFVFDRVFEPGVNQEGMWDYLSESVNHFVDGYNVSIMAYGQSGSGKSYTMGTTGKLEQEDLERMGIVPRAARALFEKLNGTSGIGNITGGINGANGAGGTATPSVFPVANRASVQALRTPKRYSTPGPQSFSASPRPTNPDRNWQLNATYVEIYNEQLRDLLLPDIPISSSGRPSISIREDARGRILLTGLHQVPINSIDDLLEVLNSGSSIRQTDSTAVNAKSSRSHAIFSLNLIQKRASVSTTLSSSALQEKRFSVPIETGATSSATPEQPAILTTIESKLHFVDLAGSERLKNTCAQGERAREGISINVGLATLGKVISQLSKHPNSHVSYRDSKLTRLLQDSLGGNAITYVIACVNPVEFHINETLNTLQYAQRARAIQSKPLIQHTFIDDRDKQLLVDRLRAEVLFLREQIRNSEGGSGSIRRPLFPGRVNGRSSIGPGSIVSSGKVDILQDRERENDLRNQVLDLQENYAALSQRHAKLVAELAKLREASDADEMSSTATTAASSAQAERLQRQLSAFSTSSSAPSFTEAIEKVVLEYEKTIQSLENSLSSARTSLSNVESELLERDIKVTHLENANLKLQSKVRKALLDREAQDERYLQELEMRQEAETPSTCAYEDKHNAMIEALRKELQRARDSELSCELYVQTLEERLAEAEQDVEQMQREIVRLENVLERERSIGKLDSLLQELDRSGGGSATGPSRAPSPGDKLASVDEDDPGLETPFPVLTDDQSFLNGETVGADSNASQREYSAESHSTTKDQRSQQVTPALTPATLLSRSGSVNNSPVKKAFLTPIQSPSKHSHQVSAGNEHEARTGQADDLVNADLDNLYDDDDDDFVVIHGMTLREQKRFYRQNLSALAEKYQRAMEKIEELESGNGQERTRQHGSNVVGGSPSSAEFHDIGADSTAAVPNDDGVSEFATSGRKHAALYSISPSLSPSASFDTHIGAFNKPRHKRKLRYLNRLSVDTTIPADQLHHESRPLARRAHSTDERSLGLLTLTSTSLRAPSAGFPVTPTFSTSLPSARRQTLPVVDELASPGDGGDSDGECFGDALDTEAALAQLRDRYRQLKVQHEATVHQVESLKAEMLGGHYYHHSHLGLTSASGIPVSPASPFHFTSPSSPSGTVSGGPGFSTSPTAPTMGAGHVIRRMSSHMLTSTDRPHYIIQQLQQRLENEFKVDRPALVAVETELQKVMLDLQMRTERVAGLESELAALKEQINQKSTIITGLTRERSSLQATASSPLDKSLLSILQEELVAKEKKMQAQAETVDQLNKEIGELKARLGVGENRPSESVIDVSCNEDVNASGVSLGEADVPSSEENSNSAVAISSLRAEHDEQLSTLRATHTEQLTHLEQKHAQTQALTDRELEAHKSLVSNLEHQLREQKSMVAKYESSIATLTNSHEAQTREMALKLDQLGGKEEAMRKRLEQMEVDYAQARGEIGKERQRVEGLVRRFCEVLGRGNGDESATSGGNNGEDRENGISVNADAKSGVDTATVDDSTIEVLLSELVASRSKLEKTVLELQKSHDEIVTELDRVRKQEQVKSRLVEELEEQLNTHYNRQMEKHTAATAGQGQGQGQPQAAHLESGGIPLPEHEIELQEARARIAALESRLATEGKGSGATSDGAAASSAERPLRHAPSQSTLPSPPPSVPLPPLPSSPLSQQQESSLPGSPSPAAPIIESGSISAVAGAMPHLHSNSHPLQHPQGHSHAHSHHHHHGHVHPQIGLINNALTNPILSPPLSHQHSNTASSSSAQATATASEVAKQAQMIEELEARLRTLEKHLFAEKQLTATLEEALTDLESSSTRLRSEMDSWRRKCLQLEEELATMRHERNESRLSMQQLEEEQRAARARIERERANLQARMHQLEGAKGGSGSGHGHSSGASASGSGRKRMGGLNCF